MTWSDTDQPASDTNSAPVRVGFLLTPDFGLLAYASAVEPLRAANRLSGRRLYDWQHVSIDGRAAHASNGIAVAPDASFTDIAFDYLFVCAGGDPAAFRHAPTFAWLRLLARSGVTLGGVSGGPYILARAGLLAGYRFTIHWEHAAAFVEDFPDLDLRRSLFEIDRDRLTTSGGTAPLDMMHALIARQHGADLAIAVSDWFLQTQVRAGAAPQRMALRDRLGIGHAKLLAALAHMESRLEEPATRSELAAIAGLSLRQLERLFQAHFGLTPGAYYLQLRLDHARHLMRQTNLSVLEVAMASGFASASHFSRAYRARHGISPRGDRRPMAALKPGAR